MRKIITKNTQVTIGMDLGDKYSHLCVLDEAGEVVEQSRVASRPKALRQRFSGPACRVVLEVGTHSPWVVRLLEGLGHEVVLANPRKVRLIYQNDSKGDRRDAETLARLGRLDPKLLHPVRHRSARYQQDLAVLRSRAALVESRTRLVNHVRGAVKSFGGRLAKCSTGSFARQAAGQIPEELRTALLPILAMISLLSRQIRKYDRQVERMAEERYPVTQLLRNVAGVGPLTATRFVLTIEDPFRFRRSRSLGAYLGLRPRRCQSGERDPDLRISKSGDRDLRHMLVQSAHYILGPFGPDSDLRRWGLGKAAGGGKAAKKRAVVAVARKLAVLLHHLWITAEVYEPLYQTEAREGNHRVVERIPA